MKLHRRTILRGLLQGTAIGIGLPALECMLTKNGDALASGEILPRRFGLFFWGNGINPEYWIPERTGDAKDYALSAQLMPLQSVKSKITVVTGCNIPIPNIVPHMSGAAGVLSGSPLLAGSTDDDNSFEYPSVDQIVAQAIGGTTRFRSLETGVQPGSGLSYNGPYSLNPPESSPHALFERVFGAGFREPGEEGLVDPTLALRRSVLDAVMDDSQRLMNKVSAADKARLEEHFEGIRALELRLAMMEEDPPDLAACMRPEKPDSSFPDIDGRPQMFAKNAAMSDLLALALACDQTRVFSHFFSTPVNNILYEGATDGHHSLTHDEPNPQPQCHDINIHIMECCAALLKALDGIQEGDSTLLDRCAVVCTSDVSLGQTHSLEDMPFVIAGSAGGRLRTGHHYRSPTRENIGKAMLSTIRAVGVSAESFGNKDGEAFSGISALES